VASEAPNPDLKPLDRTGFALGLGATGVLTAVVLVLGLWPEPLLGFGKAAATALLHPEDYIAATGIEGAGQ
jgi:multicomponent Na+:H+ antiporter subunit D